MTDVATTDAGQLVLSLPELAAEIRSEHRACEAAMADTLRHAIRAGELLRDAKAQVKHGEWLPWLADNFNGSRVTAARYMAFAANVARVQHLGSVREAVAELTTAREVEPEPEQPVADEYTEEEANALWKAELAEARAVHERGTEVTPTDPPPGAPVIPGQTAITDPPDAGPTWPQRREEILQVAADQGSDDAARALAKARDSQYMLALSRALTNVGSVLVDMEATLDSITRLDRDGAEDLADRCERMADFITTIGQAAMRQARPNLRRVQ